MRETFIRTEYLLGSAAMAKLASSRVAVFGLGGVGGHAAEALARSGIGALDLVDSDTVSRSNLNRQILALESTLGLPKVEAAAARIREIHPGCRVRIYPVFFLPETEAEFDFSAYDYVVDAIDTVSGKLALIEKARAAGVPVISAMGAGNKLDGSRFRVSDLYETSVCPLARVMRHECRKRGINSLKVVWSDEPPAEPLPEFAETAAEELSESGTSRRSVPGSAAWVTGAAGLLLAGAVIRDLVEQKKTATGGGPETGRIS